MPDTPEIPPALTPEQWREARSLPPGVAWGFGPATEGTASRHAVAAICLYGTPEGFTAEDVEMLREVVSCGCPTHAAACASVAARLAAILPPPPQERQ